MNKKAAIIAGVAIIGLVGAFALTGKKYSQKRKKHRKKTSKKHK